ncbi:cell division protein FtsQ/DivIB [Lewinella cohaerens]|uniref:cell division protein FtsQ/DivIB n=1 Tax=Lewinella cohaerens TaxID=70995 RepID=UPI000382284A|nr:cell division protein FtsQ/DivIB [Lewinella cohaerens]
MSKAKRDIVKILRMLLWAVVLLTGASMVLGAMQRKENAPIHDIVINIEPLESGDFLINEEDIPLILEKRFAHPITAFPVGKLDVQRLERVLEEDPFVKSAEAYIDAEDRINIELVQREPVLRVMDNNGLNYYLDKEGNQMPPSEHYAARVRVTTGNLPPYEPGFLEEEDHLLRQVFALNELLREDPFLEALVEQIYINKRGEFILSPKVGRQTILFGRYQKAEEKLSRLKTFYREGLPYKGWQAYSSFDFRYEGQVVCKKR